jgi:hypothetical protein
VVNQRLSDPVNLTTYKEPPDHRLAVNIVKFYLCAKGAQHISDPYKVSFPTRFCLRHFKPKDKRTFFGHNYDLAVFWTDFQYDIGVPSIIIEVDDRFDSKHATKSGKINDGINTSYVEEHMYDTELIRLQKREILDFEKINNFYYLHNSIPDV